MRPGGVGSGPPGAPIPRPVPAAPVPGIPRGRPQASPQRPGGAANHGGQGGHAGGGGGGLPSKRHYNYLVTLLVREGLITKEKGHELAAAGQRMEEGVNLMATLRNSVGQEKLAAVMKVWTQQVQNQRSHEDASAPSQQPSHASVRELALGLQSGAPTPTRPAVTRPAGPQAHEPQPAVATSTHADMGPTQQTIPGHSMMHPRTHGSVVGVATSQPATGVPLRIGGMTYPNTNQAAMTMRAPNMQLPISMASVAPYQMQQPGISMQGPMVPPSYQMQQPGRSMPSPMPPLPMSQPSVQRVEPLKRQAPGPPPEASAAKRAAVAKGSAAKPIRGRKPVEDPNAPADQVLDVLEGAQIDVAQEQAALLSTFATVKAGGPGEVQRPKERVQSDWVDVDAIERCFNLVGAQGGLPHISPEVLEAAVRAVEARFEPLLQRTVKMAMHRSRGPGGRKDVKITSDKGRVLREARKKEAEKQASKEATARSKLEELADSSSKKVKRELARNKQVAKQVEQLKQQRYVDKERQSANKVLADVFGYADGFAKLRQAREKAKVEKALRKGGGDAEKEVGEKAAVEKPRRVVKVLLKDLTAAMALDPHYRGSMELWRLRCGKRALG